MNTDRIQREQSFHDNRFSSGDGEREATGKFYSIAKNAIARYRTLVHGLSKDNHLLEYGCGTGDNSSALLKQGARVTGIDISPEGIKKAKEKIKNSDFHADYFVMDAENTEFSDSSFDTVFGTGIIHHLDVKKSYQELSRILKPDGHIVFFEPLGHNPFINLYRMLTPKMRTEDEHPLKQEDIKLLKKYFYISKEEYYCLFSLLATPFRNTFIFIWLYAALEKVDKIVFLLPFMRKYAWIVLIHAYNPRK